VTQRPQVEVGRLANAVDMFIEGQSVINSHSQTPDAGCMDMVLNCYN